MTIDAVRRCVGVLIVLMALSARNRLMRSSQWEPSRIVIEASALPRNHRVTRLTVRRKVCGGMIRISRRRVIGLMTRDALRWCWLEDLILVTREALRSRVRPRQRKRCQRVIESCAPNKRRHLMALDAVGRKSGGNMVGRLRENESVAMAAIAINRRSRVLLERSIGMTRLTM